MNTPTYLVLLLVFAVVLFLKGGTDKGVLYIFLAAAALCAIPWYFGTRDRTKPASLVEKTLATLWVWFRRLIGLTLGGGLIVGGLFMATSSKVVPSLSNFLGALGLAAFGAFVVYLGIFGQGHEKHDFRDDIRLHRENKRRYRWWF
jgi:hypothetical protein